jgi:hypothetical protein
MSKRWFLITRSITLLSLMVILAPVLISDVLEFQNYYGHLVRLILPSPVWAPYFVILWNLRAAVCSDTKRVKKSLALAISWGVFIFLLSAFLLFAGWSACEPDWRGIVLSAAIALLQVILVFSAMRTYYFMERDTDDRQILATRALIGIAGIVLSALFIPTFVLPHNASFESKSVGSLRTIVAAQQTYSDDTRARDLHRHSRNSAPLQILRNPLA